MMLMRRVSCQHAHCLKRATLLLLLTRDGCWCGSHSGAVLLQRQTAFHSSSHWDSTLGKLVYSKYPYGEGVPRGARLIGDPHSPNINCKLALHQRSPLGGASRDFLPLGRALLIAVGQDPSSMCNPWHP